MNEKPYPYIVLFTRQYGHIADGEHLVAMYINGKLQSSVIGALNGETVQRFKDNVAAICKSSGVPLYRARPRDKKRGAYVPAVQSVGRGDREPPVATMDKAYLGEAGGDYARGTGPDDWSLAARFRSAH